MEEAGGIDPHWSSIKCAADDEPLSMIVSVTFGSVRRGGDHAAPDADSRQPYLPPLSMLLPVCHTKHDTGVTHITYESLMYINATKDCRV